MERWKPIRKVLAAYVAALFGTGGAGALFLAGQIDGKAFLAAAFAGLGTAITAYMTRDKDGLPLDGGFELDPDPGEMR